MTRRAPVICCCEGAILRPVGQARETAVESFLTVSEGDVRHPACGSCRLAWARRAPVICCCEGAILRPVGPARETAVESFLTVAEGNVRHAACGRCGLGWARRAPVICCCKGAILRPVGQSRETAVEKTEGNVRHPACGSCRLLLLRRCDFEAGWASQRDSCREFSYGIRRRRGSRAPVICCCEGAILRPVGQARETAVESFLTVSEGNVRHPACGSCRLGSARRATVIWRCEGGIIGATPVRNSESFHCCL